MDKNEMMIICEMSDTELRDKLLVLYRKNLMEENEIVTVKLYCEDEIYAKWYKCDKCECSDILDTFDYCPNCGKKINWE